MSYINLHEFKIKFKDKSTPKIPILKIYVWFIITNLSLIMHGLFC